MDIPNINKDRKRRKPSVTDTTPLLYGKVPPQARELEQAVLGAIMLEKSAFDTVTEILKPECLYSEANQIIFRSMYDLQQKNMPIDLLTVVEELKSQEMLDQVGGAYYLTRLTNSVVSSANIETHARIILEKFIQRELIRISGEIIGSAYEEGTDVFDLLDESEAKMFHITNNYLKKNFTEIGDAITETLTRIDMLRTKTEDISGVPSGFSRLDKVTFGWQPTDLIILAARPSVGKTAFALNLARNAALHPTQPVPVGFFSLEMSASQLVMRILSAESEIDMRKITRGKLENYEYEQLLSRGIKRLESAPIFIDDTASLNIFEFRAKARRLVNKNKVGLIIIDYLQLMGGSVDRNSNREQEISSISRNLKSLAKELNIPIVALSQLSREVEKRKENNKMPQLSDLRESGAIEQDADLVMFLYRPEYHEINNNDMGESTKGETFLKIAKHRNGTLETIKLKAMLHIQKFQDGEPDEGIGYAPPQQSGGSWRAISDDGGAKLYIQKGSKMNDSPMNDDDDGSPF